MMQKFKISAVGGAVLISGLALAAPANADLGPGIYIYRSVMANGVSADTMMRVDSCGPGCLSLYNLDTYRDQGQAISNGTQYVLDQFALQGAYCPDGRTVDVYARYTFDLDGTNGVYTLNGPNPCGGTDPVGETTFEFIPVP